MAHLALVLVLFLCLFCQFATRAETGEGNIDGGGGDMGGSLGDSAWNGGDDGVRVTVIRVSDRSPVTTPIDLTNRAPSNIQVHFGKASKVSYFTGRALTPTTDIYHYINPAQPIPRIISSGAIMSSIPEIRSYFTDEQVIRAIALQSGMNYDTLVGGDYKLLLEPIAYLKYNGIQMAMTATEAALYDLQTGGDLSYQMGSLTRKNLPLAMFLETPDLGFSPWTGSTTARVSNDDILSFLGLGIVRFREPDSPALEVYDYEYRTGTDVITAATVSGGRSDPDNPVTVRFHIGDTIYNVGNVYYPAGDSQLVWVRWTTPSVPQTITIRVTVTGGGSVSGEGVITARVTDLSGNDPPNPVADDRNDDYLPAPVPTNVERATASWSVWRPWWYSDWVWHVQVDGTGYWCDHGWWEFASDRYTATLSGSVSVVPDGVVPTAEGKTLKSGYGFTNAVTADVTTTQDAATTGAQTALAYFPEFRYGTYWRRMERTAGGYHAQFEFAENPHSTYRRRVHFTPVWMRDGAYTVYTWLLDCWTPAGMLSANLADTLTIRGTLWDDWHIAPKQPG